ncbi:MAG: hypothetical protein HYY20_12555 [Candidatus Tectomicrobia bacterium]|uniref:Band 7 domain-containing protein n=1 Tax=Tectimicrobiota bacterium TaxID=2528274 RepID=A0A932CS84_UNCTE|nr:hypothetical protein [Candidatus Tectomicrobia bacterium]
MPGWRWAPFIPLWSKEWILPFAVAGLFIPNLRRYLAFWRYESELNQLVVRANREIERIGLAYLTSGEALSARVRGREEALPVPKSEKRLAERLHYFDRREEILGRATHRVIQALNIQTSDGYAVVADVTLLYSITDPVRIARDFGWGSLYVDTFAINTFRNGVLATLGKINAESFYNGAVRVAAVKEAEGFLRQRFAERGFKVERLLLRNYKYAENYERSLQEKKVAVQLAKKNQMESLVNEEKAKLKQIESSGNAAITIAESGVSAQIAKVRAEANLYSSQVRAKADTELNVAVAEAKRLKVDALTRAGGRYVVALEIAKMFNNIEGAAMTPEQYIAFIRNAWAVIGVSPCPAGGKR